MVKRFTWGLVLLVLVQAPLIFALDCNSISIPNKDTCLGIINSNLTHIEKEFLISNLEYSKKFYPDHDYIKQVNSNIPINQSPDKVRTVDSIFIKNAWNSVLAIMPSVIYNNSLYVPNKTSILTGFNYNLVIPQNYQSPKYSYTDQQDCRRDYSLIENNSQNSVYINNDYSGEGRLTNVSINNDSEIKSIYKISVKVKIDHYQWQDNCEAWTDGNCAWYSHRCEFYNSEIKNDNLQTSDETNIRLYNKSLFGEIKTDSYSNTTRIKLNYSDSIELSFNDSRFTFYKYAYTINYSKAPYYVSTLKAEDFNQETLSNILKSEDSLLVRNNENCTLRYFDFFRDIKGSCNIPSHQVTFHIITNKLAYKVNESIIVNIFPQNISVNLSYSNISVSIEGNYTFKADLSKNKIIAQYLNFETEKIVFVSDGKKLVFLWEFGIFLFFNYSLYSVLKRYWGRIL